LTTSFAKKTPRVLGLDSSGNLALSDYSYTNLQIKTTDSEAVRSAIHVCDIGSAKVLGRADTPWVGVYPFLTEGDYGYLKIAGEKLSNRLQLPLVAFFAPSATEVKYALYKSGTLLDEYSRKVIDETLEVMGGDAEKLFELFNASSGKKRLQSLLHPPKASAAEHRNMERFVFDFAEALAIPRVQLCTGYNHLKWARAGR
jgi:hypothetical protein